MSSGSSDSTERSEKKLRDDTKKSDCVGFWEVLAVKSDL